MLDGSTLTTERQYVAAAEPLGTTIEPRQVLTTLLLPVRRVLTVNDVAGLPETFSTTTTDTDFGSNFLSKSFTWTRNRIVAEVVVTSYVRV